MQMLHTRVLLCLRCMEPRTSLQACHTGDTLSGHLGEGSAQVEASQVLAASVLARMVYLKGRIRMGRMLHGQHRGS